MDYRKELTTYLFQFLNERRQTLLTEDLAIRSNHLTLVLEDFYHPHNISAAIRTSDCFGLTDVHVIENTVNYERNPGINKGSDKWMTIHRYCSAKFNTPSCIESLKSQGYQIIATSPHVGSYDTRDLPISTKTAIVMGSESYGASRYVLDQADGFLKINTPGFTESLNVSVAAGIILETLTHRMRTGNIDWRLNEHEWEGLMLRNIGKMLPDSHLIEKRFRETLATSPQEFLFPSTPVRRSTVIH